MNKYIDIAVEEAYKGINNKDGGPFGAIIIKDNKIISCSHNTVLKDKDPTAHAEVNAIREACKKLNTYDLSECSIYTTCEPCPMCMSAIMWANIDKVYYASTRKDAEHIGFRDNSMYDYFKGNNYKIEEIKIESTSCKELMNSYKNKLY